MLEFDSECIKDVVMEKPGSSSKAASDVDMVETFRIEKTQNGTRLIRVDMGVNPKIMGKPPKSSILIGFGTIINHPFWGFSSIFRGFPLK